MPTADLLILKLLLNSVISTHNAKSMMMDIKNFYLNIPLKRYEYFQLNLKGIPKDVTAQYALKDKAIDDGWVYVEILKEMYGLPQAGLLVHKLMEQQLSKTDICKADLPQGFGNTT